MPTPLKSRRSPRSLSPAELGGCKRSLVALGPVDAEERPKGQGLCEGLCGARSNFAHATQLGVLEARTVHPLFRSGALGSAGEEPLQVRDCLEALVERLARLEDRLEWWNEQHQGHLDEALRSQRPRTVRHERQRTRLHTTHDKHKPHAAAAAAAAAAQAPEGAFASEAGAADSAPAPEADKPAALAAVELPPAAEPPSAAAGEPAGAEGAGVEHRASGKRSRCTHPALALQAGYHRDASGKSELEEPKRLNLLQRLIHHPLFDNFFASVILMNALFIAAQTEFLARRAGGPPSPSADLAFNVIDKIFAAAFAIEFVLRLAALRCGFFVGAGCCWNVFDMLLVIMSGVEVVMQLSGLDSQGPEADASAGKVMRMFRMARIIRIMRVLRFLDELRIMVLLILHSVRSLFWLMVLLCIILFVFSIFFTQGAADFLDGPDPELMGPTLDKYYGSLANSALTLFTAITGGVSWREVMEPLSYAGWLFTALFILYVSFCVFSVLNIVTGVFVDGAIQRSAQERDLRLEKEREQKQEYISMLMDLLTEIDTDQTGVITRGALEDAFQREQVKYTFSVLDIDIHDSNYLFDMLDLDRSGEVDTEEFVLGCLRLKGNAKSIDIHTLMFEVKHMLQKWDLLMSEESDKREAGPGHDES